VPATLRDCARFSVYYASTFFLLEVIAGPIIAVVTGGHKVLTETFFIHVFGVLAIFPSGLVASYGAARLFQLDDESLGVPTAIVAGVLADLLLWTGLYLLRAWDVSLLSGLGVMLSAFVGAVLQGLTVVAASSTLSLGLIWKLRAIRRRKLKQYRTQRTRRRIKSAIAEP
jgi:hypothetical protein